MALIRDPKLANLLREGHFEEFNRLAAQEPSDLRNAEEIRLSLTFGTRMRAR